jgi:general secretion pathway protein G
MRAHMKLGLVLLAATGVISIPVYRMGNDTLPNNHQQLSADVRELTTALQAYRRARGEYPATLHALVEQQHAKRLPLDPWKRDYVYRCPGIHNRDGYDLFSAGPDHKSDTADDDWGDQ